MRSPAARKTRGVEDLRATPLRGGRGDDVIFGEDGDDLLVGDAGRDLLVGGAGEDRIVGNADDDVLISGLLDFARDSTALAAIMAEWTSGRSYAERTANLMGLGSGARLNGEYFLAVDGPSATVHDDNAKDTLTGDAGRDWFFANLVLDPDDDATKKDKITDLSANEFALDLDFILAGG